MKPLSDELLEQEIVRRRNAYDKSRQREESARRDMTEKAHELRVMLVEKEKRRKRGVGEIL